MDVCEAKKGAAERRGQAHREGLTAGQPVRSAGPWGGRALSLTRLAQQAVLVPASLNWTLLGLDALALLDSVFAAASSSLHAAASLPGL